MKTEILINNIWYAVPEIISLELQRLKKFSEQVTALRTNQKAYFKSGNKDLLNDCKKLERVIDSTIIELGKPIVIENKLF